jgi:hypothetical protein
MLYREIIAVCSQIHIKHINTLCGRNAIDLYLHICLSLLFSAIRKVKEERPRITYYVYACESLTETERMSYLGVEGRIILKWTLCLEWRAWTRFIWHSLWTSDALM